ncbi:unnamed protein product [Porites lobata]|uniref:EF-hand domain-containing protein n=1 Tax=Porites lobata TaxID=104759 RepID=A0ABN8RI83_9CNID|nr:unnamed protein product [Porites lobata]
MADTSSPNPSSEPEKPAAESSDSSAAELQKTIADAFDIFDHESNKTVDVREVGTIVRSLKCCPTEGELHDILAEVEEEEPTGYIRFEKFEPAMLKILLERRYKPAPEDQIMKAFEVLDQENKGYLTTEELTKYMSEEGEPFTQEEMEEMLSAAVDPDKGIVFYKDFVSMMVVEDYNFSSNTFGPILWDIEKHIWRLSDEYFFISSVGCTKSPIIIYVGYLAPFKMAAFPEREYRKLLTDSLLSEEVSNSYTLDEFKDFFPRKYRDHQDVKVLYEAYQTKRKLIRDRVVMNVRMHCRKRKQQVS